MPRSDLGEAQIHPAVREKIGPQAPAGLHVLRSMTRLGSNRARNP
jgi:hypothetical protein